MGLRSKQRSLCWCKEGHLAIGKILQLKGWENYPKLLISAERELLINLEEGQPFRLRRFETSSIKSDSPAYLDIKGRFPAWRHKRFNGRSRKGGWTLSDDVISSKTRETMLVGGKLPSRSPHCEGSERNDSLKVVKRGLNPFWWRKLKQRHDGYLMSWKLH